MTNQLSLTQTSHRLCVSHFCLIPYWDKNKSQQSHHYRKDVQKKKRGRKCFLEVKKEFLLVLLRLKLGLMERLMADMFSVTVSTFSRVYITWVRFLALALKGSLPRWPSVQELLLIVRSFFYTKAFISKRTKSNLERLLASQPL